MLELELELELETDPGKKSSQHDTCCLASNIIYILYGLLELGLG
jgi:hypothetical protein